MKKSLAFLEKNQTLLGAWRIHETLVNRFGIATLEEVYSFDDYGFMEWRYSETGAPNEYQKFNYTVQENQITIIPTNSYIPTLVDFIFLNDTLSLRMEDWSDYITLTRVC